MKQEALLPDAPTSSGLTGADVARALAGYRLPVSPESAMQEAIGLAFTAEGIPHRREVTRGADRIDFVVGRVGVECKVAGSVADVIRQLHRYGQWEELDEIVLVTTLARHLSVARELNGKKVRVHIVRGLF